MHCQIKYTKQGSTRALAADISCTKVDIEVSKES